MTTGHKHWKVRVKRGGWIHRLLTQPISYETDADFAEASPYPYGVLDLGMKFGVIFYLSPMSYLHRWTGLTLVVSKE